MERSGCAAEARMESSGWMERPNRGSELRHMRKAGTADSADLREPRGRQIWLAAFSQAGNKI